MEDHAVGCADGGLKVALHNAVDRELCQVLEDTGATVRIEALVPEFAPVTTRHLDIWAFYPFLSIVMANLRACYILVIYL